MAEKVVTVRIIGDSSSASKAFADAEVSASGFESTIGKVASTAAGVALGGAISQAPGYLLDAAKAAAEDSANMDRLKTAIENASGSYEPYNAAVQQAITDGQAKAFSDDETRNALTLLVSETGSTEEAMKRLSVAQDLARGTGMDLETASKLLGKVTDDNTKVLGRYGIVVKDGATAQDVLNTVDAKFGGQAATFAQTDAAKMQIMADRVSELQEQLGYMLLPVLTLVVGAGLQLAEIIATRVVPAFAGFIAGLQPIVDFIGGNLGPIIAGLSGVFVALVAVAVPAIIAWTVATWANVTAQIALAAATVAAYLPIIAIVAAVGIAVALLYEAWTTNFLGIQDITMAAIGWMQANVLPVLEAIFSGIVIALGIARDLFVAAWPVMQAAVAVAWTLIGGYITSLEGVIQTIAAVVGGMVAIVSDLIHGDFSGAWTDAQAMVQGVYDGISTILSGLPAMVLGFFVDTTTQALAEIGNLATGVTTALEQLLVDAGVTMAGLPGAITGAIGDLYQLGYDTLLKFADGIGDALSHALDVVTGWVGKIGGALGKINVPGFSPPDQAGYEIGQMYGMNLAGGIGDALPAISGALDRIGGSMARSPGGVAGNRGGGMGALSHAEIVAALREGGRQAARELLTGTL